MAPICQPGRPLRAQGRGLDPEGVIVPTARDSFGDIGYAIFDKDMSHLHYVETRRDRRRQGIAATLWRRVLEESGQHDITAVANTDEGRERLVTWGFTQADGMWTCRRTS